MKSVAAFLCAAYAALPAAAISVTWTGYAGNNQWETNNNWYPNHIPGPNDDVTIPKGKVEVTSATGVNSLSMGNDFSEPANLTLFKSFYIGSGGMTVEGNGNLFVNTGLDQVTGEVNVAGHLYFIDGSIGGQWTTNSQGVADLSTPGEKALIGCQLTTAGPLKLGGVLVLNQSSVVTANGAVTSSGVIIQAGDKTKVEFDASKGSFTFHTGVLSLQAPVKLGAFSLVSGNLTLFSAITFNSILSIPSGSFVSALGNAVVAFPAGASGAGAMSFMNAKTTLSALNMTGDVNIGGGDASFATKESSVGVLTFMGGNTFIGATVACKQLNLLGGVSSGTSVVAAEQIYTKSNGFTLSSPVTASKSVSFDKTSLTFNGEGKFTILASAIAQTIGELQLMGPAYLPGLVNNGAFSASSALSSQNIDITGTGTLSVASTVTVNTAQLKQNKITLAAGAVVKGATTTLGVNSIAAKTEGATVNGVIGQYRFECPQQCEKVATTGAEGPAQAFTFSA